MSKLRRLYDNTFWVWCLIIFGGLVAQMFKTSYMEPDMARLLDHIEIGVTFTLAFEILFRMLCKWRGFFKSSLNIADLIIAIVTVVMQLPPIKKSETLYAWLTIFQIIRIYRVVWAVPVTRNLLVCSPSALIKAVM